MRWLCLIVTHKIEVEVFCQLLYSSPTSSNLPQFSRVSSSIATATRRSFCLICLDSSMEENSSTTKDGQANKTIKKLESAIVASLLGLSPKVDGERLIAVIPPLTKEHIQAMDTAKKLYSHAPKDDVKKLEKEVDELTKKIFKSAEDMCKAKAKEIAGG